MSIDNCYDCGVRPGELHRPGCDVEQCPHCGWQLLTCPIGGYWPPKECLPWTGLLPGVAECREFGWFARLVPGKGWVSCDPEEPGAAEDLNRLFVEAKWDRRRKRFVLPS